MIIRKDNESIDSMLKRFKKEGLKSGRLIEYNKHRYYESKSLKRKKKTLAAIKRRKKEEAKLAKYVNKYGIY